MSVADIEGARPVPLYRNVTVRDPLRLDDFCVKPKAKFAKTARDPLYVGDISGATRNCGKVLCRG